MSRYGCASLSTRRAQSRSTAIPTTPLTPGSMKWSSGIYVCGLSSLVVVASNTTSANDAAAMQQQLLAQLSPCAVSVQTTLHSR